MSAKELVSTRQCGKTLKSFYDYIEQIRNWKVDNYVLYIKKDFWNRYKDEIKDYLLDIEIVITNNLPKNVNAVFMKKVDWRYINEC